MELILKLHRCCLDRMLPELHPILQLPPHHLEGRGGNWKPGTYFQQKDSVKDIQLIHPKCFLLISFEEISLDIAV